MLGLERGTASCWATARFKGDAGGWQDGVFGLERRAASCWAAARGADSVRARLGDEGACSSSWWRAAKKPGGAKEAGGPGYASDV